MTYTDAQLVLLSAASQRDDGLLPRPNKLAGAALRTLETSLVKAGAAEPVTVRSDQPTWRLDEAEVPIGMRITNTGLQAIGIEPAAATDDAHQTATSHEHDPSDATLLATPAAAPQRTGTKRALLVELLSAAEGATIETFVTTLGWQPHTLRAALTRLRQDGFVIVATKNAEKRALYRIAGADAEGVAAEQAEAVAP